jgi:hypothetical protein
MENNETVVWRERRKEEKARKGEARRVRKIEDGLRKRVMKGNIPLMHARTRQIYVILTRLHSMPSKKGRHQ